MPNILSIEQNPLQPVFRIDVDEATIIHEPTVRRATPEFAYEVGGQILRNFLDKASAAGYVHDNSLVMSQPSDFREGFFSVSPGWHFDFNPRVTPDTDENFKQAVWSNTGLVVCVFSEEKHPEDEGTLFLRGEVRLDLEMRDASNENASRVPRPDINEAVVRWWDSTVRKQIEDETDPLVVKSLAPNEVCIYGSHNLHRTPIMRSNKGQRLILRINTPNDPEVKAAENIHIKQDDPSNPRYFFRETGEDTWVREKH